MLTFIDGFHGVWLHFRRARVGICVQCSCVLLCINPSYRLYPEGVASRLAMLHAMVMSISNDNSFSPDNSILKDETYWLYIYIIIWLIF